MKLRFDVEWSPASVSSEEKRSSKKRLVAAHPSRGPIRKIIWLDANDLMSVASVSDARVGEGMRLQLKSGIADIVRKATRPTQESVSRS